MTIENTLEVGGQPPALQQQFNPQFLEYLDKVGIRQEGERIFREIIDYQNFLAQERAKDFQKIAEWDRQLFELTKDFKGNKDDLEVIKKGFKGETLVLSDPLRISFMQMQAKVGQITRSLKEIPDIPSETPREDDTNHLVKVESREEGGIYTYMSSHKYPYKGFPFFEYVDRIDLVKKTSRAFLSGLYHQLKKVNKVSLITLLPAFWIGKHVLRAAIYVFYRVIERFKMRPTVYCDAIRELHRAFSSYGPQSGLRLQLRDVICMILEMDNAYRFRFQDITEDLNKENLKAHPVDELKRLLNILSSREQTQEIKDTWKLLKYAVYYLYFDKELKNILVDVLSSLDTAKTILDENDKYFCEKRIDYKFKYQICQPITTTN